MPLILDRLRARALIVLGDRSRRVDAALALAIVALAIALGAATEPWCAPGFDCASYVAMAVDPAAAPSLPPQHAARILPSVVVYPFVALGIASPLAVFRVLTVAAFAALGLGCYASFRRGGAVPAAALAGVLWIGLVPWPFANHFKDVAQAGYGWTFPAFLAIAWLTERRRAGSVAVVGLAAALCRQELVFAAAFALGELAWRARSARPLAWLAGIVAGFAAVQHLVSPGANAYMDRSLALLSTRVVLATAAPWMVSGLVWAFLPMLAVTWRLVARALARAPWTVLYVGAVTGLEVANAPLAGPNNFARLILIAAFPIWWLVAREVMSRAAPTWVWLASAAVFVGYAALRRNTIESAGPALVIAPALVIPVFGLVAPVVVLALLRFTARAPEPRADPVV